MKLVSNFQLLLTVLNIQHRIMSGLNFLKREDNDFGVMKEAVRREGALSLLKKYTIQ